MTAHTGKPIVGPSSAHFANHHTNATLLPANCHPDLCATLVASVFSAFAFATLLPPHCNSVAMPIPVAAVTAIRLSPNCHPIATNRHPIATRLPRNCHAIVTQLTPNCHPKLPALLPAAIPLPALLLPRLPCHPIVTQLPPIATNCHPIATGCHAIFTQLPPQLPPPIASPVASRQPIASRQPVASPVASALLDCCLPLRCQHVNASTLKARMCNMLAWQQRVPAAITHPALPLPNTRNTDTDQKSAAPIFSAPW